MLKGINVLQEFLGSRWPQELGESFKDNSLKFQEKTHDVAVKLLRALAISLGRDEDEFAEVSMLSLGKQHRDQYCRVWRPQQDSGMLLLCMQC